MKIHIISGFLGSGKTTFLNRYLPLLKGRTVVIENEFGDTSIDSNLIEKNTPVYEIYSGCICCTLVGNFQKGIREIYEKYSPEHIVIEPSGVGKLSDVINACYLTKRVEKLDLSIERLIVLVDADACKDFLEDFGEFYSNQIENAKLILLSHLNTDDRESVAELLEILKSKNSKAVIYGDDWRNFDNKELGEVIALSEDFSEIRFKLDTHNIPADKVFSTIKIDNFNVISSSDFKNLLQRLKEATFGYIIRAKGIVPCLEGDFLVQYSYGKIELIHLEDNKIPYNLVIIGCNLNESNINDLFNQI